MISFALTFGARKMNSWETHNAIRRSVCARANVVMHSISLESWKYSPHRRVSSDGGACSNQNACAFYRYSKWAMVRVSVAVTLFLSHLSAMQCSHTIVFLPHIFIPENSAANSFTIRIIVRCFSRFIVHIHQNFTHYATWLKMYTAWSWARAVPVHANLRSFGQMACGMLFWLFCNSVYVACCARPRVCGAYSCVRNLHSKCYIAIGVCLPNAQPAREHTHTRGYNGGWLHKQLHKIVCLFRATWIQFGAIVWYARRPMQKWERSLKCHFDGFFLFLWWIN